jgi:hypothetical protein
MYRWVYAGRGCACPIPTHPLGAIMAEYRIKDIIIALGQAQAVTNTFTPTSFGCCPLYSQWPPPVCPGRTIHCQFPSVYGCPTRTCVTFTCPAASCFGQTRLCEFNTLGGCGPASPVVDPGDIQGNPAPVSIADAKAMLKSELARLEALEAAEAAVPAEHLDEAEAKLTQALEQVRAMRAKQG